MLIMQEPKFIETFCFNKNHGLTYFPCIDFAIKSKKGHFWPFLAIFRIISLIMREPDFSWTCGFRQKLSIHLYSTLANNRQNRWTQFFTKCEKPQKKGQKGPKNVFLIKKRPFLIFFQKSGSVSIFYYFFWIFAENFSKIHRAVWAGQRDRLRN